MLSNGEPFLVHTRVHDTASNMSESTQTASIVLEWADLVQKCNQPTVICMDSYYLDNLGRKLLKDRGVRYIAALKPDRFRILTNLLKQQVNNIEDSSWAWNEARGEVAVYHKSRDKRIGEKFASSNCFAAMPNKMRRHEEPIYDEYKAMFSGCAHIQPQAPQSDFSLRPSRDTNTAVEKKKWNYLFTSVLINTWKAWKVAYARNNIDQIMSGGRNHTSHLCPMAQTGQTVAIMVFCYAWQRTMCWACALCNTGIVWTV